MAETSINASRLRLTPFTDSHLTEIYIGWLNNKELMRYSEQRHIDHTVISCQRYLESFEGSDNYFWAIEEKMSNKHIGNITAYIDRNNNLANLSLLIGDDSAHGKGYGHEAWGAALKWLLNDFMVRKIIAGTMEENKAMLKIMQHSGMNIEGTFENHYLLNGTQVDIIFMSIFSSKQLGS
mgnify:CR=1 FL=1